MSHLVSELAHYHDELNDKIRTLTEENTRLLGIIKKVFSDLPTPSTSNLKLKDIIPEIARLNLAIDNVKKAFASLSNSELMLGMAFKNRICELGFTFETIEKILGYKGMYVLGRVVAQVLLGEKWDGENPLSFVSLRDELDFASLVGLKRAHHLDVHTKGDDGRYWKRTVYFEGDCTHPIFVFNPFPSPNESDDNFNVRLESMTLSDAIHIIRFDFFTSFFDGTTFTVFNPRSLFEKHHTLTERVDPSIKEEYTTLGFRFSRDVIGSHDDIASFDSSSPIPSTRKESQQSQAPSSSSPSSPSSSSSIRSLGMAFEERIYELGIDYTRLRSVIGPDKACIFGGVVSQVLLDEKWGVDAVRIATLANAIEFAGYHKINIRTIIDRNGGEWSETTYSGVWDTPISVYCPLNFIVQTLEEAVHMLANVTFLRPRFDGVHFSTDECQSLIQKCHNSDIDVDKKVIKKFTSLGFAFHNGDCIYPMRVNLLASLPHYIVSLEKKVRPIVQRRLII